MIGVTLKDRYKIEKLIGEGATATVYRGLDTELERHVAIKILLPHVHNTTRQRFRIEGRAVAKLTHPNIMAVYDVGKDGDHEFLVVELIDGKPLYEYIPATAQRVGELGYQICLALDYAHKNDVIHRDIKPANIYVTADDQIKLMDFGLAIGRETKRVTAQGTIIGTPAYLSPEQAQGFDLDQRTDIYTTGIVLYELLTGQLPFDADDITSILLQQVKKPAVPPSTFMDVPELLEKAILKSMEKKPDNRFQTAGDMAESLADFLGIEAQTTPAPAETVPAKSAKPEAPAIKLVLADDHVILRTSLAMFLNACEGLEVLAECSDGDSAYKKVEEVKPDVLLLDLNMPGTSGLTILPKLRKDFPDLKVLVLTGRDENVYIMKALRNGANGYVLKTIEEQELEMAVRDVAAGNMVLGHGVAQKVIAGLSEFDGDKPLNALQLDILSCVAAGLEKDDIAERLGMPEDDVMSELITILDSLKVKSNTDAALMALRAGWISLDAIHNF